MIKKLLQSSILTNTLYTLGGKFAAMLLYMALDIACARILSLDDYAEWVFFYVIFTMMCYVGWCGINTSAKVFVSKESDGAGVTKTIQASFLLRLIVSTAISIIIISVAYPLAKWMGYPSKYPNLFCLCFFAGVMVFLNSYSEFFKEMFMGLGDFKRVCFFTTLEFLGYFVFSVLFLIFMKNVKAMALGYVCSGIVILVIGVISLKHITGARILPGKMDGYQAIMWKILKYAIPIAVSSVGGMILVEMDTFMLGILSTKSQIANYGIAKNLCTKAVHVNYALTVGSMTSFSVLTVENIRAKYSSFKRVGNLNILISAVIAAAFLLLGNTMIMILYGAEYCEAGKILNYLVPYYIMYAISSFYATFLDFQGKAKTRSVCYCSVVMLNLILNSLLIPKFGAVGASVATSISLVPYTVLVMIITRRVIGSYSKGNLN